MVQLSSEDLPHKSGITTPAVHLHAHAADVGRLAPQIGDYDFRYEQVVPLVAVGRLAPQIGDYDEVFTVKEGEVLSEDLPHKSGITTQNQHP